MFVSAGSTSGRGHRAHNPTTEEMFHTFPNESCHLRLEKDCNYDPDLGAFRMDALPFGESYKWGVLVDTLIHDYSYVLDSPRR